MPGKGGFAQPGGDQDLPPAADSAAGGHRPFRSAGRCTSSRTTSHHLSITVSAQPRNTLAECSGCSRSAPGNCKGSSRVQSTPPRPHLVTKRLPTPAPRPRPATPGGRKQLPAGFCRPRPSPPAPASALPSRHPRRPPPAAGQPPGPGIRPRSAATPPPAPADQRASAAVPVLPRPPRPASGASTHGCASGCVPALNGSAALSPHPPGILRRVNPAATPPAWSPPSRQGSLSCAANWPKPRPSSRPLDGELLALRRHPGMPPTDPAARRPRRRHVKDASSTT